MARDYLEYHDWGLNNYIDLMATKRNVYITAKNMNCYNDPNLSSTSFRFSFVVFHRTRSDTDPMSYSRIHSSYLCIHCPFESLASAGEAKAVVERMLSASNPEFPFYIVDQLPLECFDDVITRISEAAACIARGASESGRNVASDAHQD
ncbi:hypothetical protein TIFTF001_050077 [Ficus carica]|uniref:Uncharacterized protein n=1 Tax=Ficus carica TaxID=3494 RepID=A0AA87YSF6_FICCA|nr:hypothetical protein TIFTF001_050077 [Ficus carica]